MLEPLFQKHSPTSKAAALSVSPTTLDERSKEMLLLIAKHKGLTDFEIQKHMKLDGNSQRPVRVQLRDKGFIIDGGKRRPTDKKRMAVVWVINTNIFKR